MKSKSLLALTAMSMGVCAALYGEGAQATPTTIAMNTYFGTTHSHTGLNNDHGADQSTAEDTFEAAKATNYQFLVLTEHSGPTGPVDQAGYYADAQAQAAAFTEDGAFVGLAGYEYSENGGDGDSDSGHMTGFGTEDYVNATAPGMGFSMFLSILTDDAATRPVFAGFNHPKATGHGASATSLLTSERRQYVVMSETSNKVAYNATNEANFYRAFIVHLDRGWRVAPTCGIDTHGLRGLRQAETATKKPCRTGLLAPELTRTSVLDAIMERRMYSTRDTNLQVRYSVNDFWMGSLVGLPVTATFAITVADPDTGTANDRVKRLEVIGSGGVILASQTFDAHSVTWNPTLTVGTNKYMFVRVFTGERTAHTAVAAPVWFE